MSIFIDQEQEIVVKVHSTTLPNGQFIAFPDSNLSDAKENLDIDTSSLEEHTVVFKRPDYADDVRDTSNALALTDDGFALNTNVVRFNRFNSLLKRWSFKDSDGNDIPPDKDHIATLNPVIADSIMYEFEVAIDTGK